ncbi:hypothetical protein Lalb_Chr20g0123371 [Lupinus albus]|uniref:Uncharacterized protein n=1 Tax=Lupinus albus TaxID=3870 RepID=A0A6A4NWY3_LUPAL|nr:hypothetical protein Lalb_Chr20g0123371 [Lupinus albus]
MFLTFYKGIKINIWPFHINLLHLNGHVILLHDDSNNKLVGDLCGIASCFSYALRVIIQMSKEYSNHYSSTALMSTSGAIQTTIYGLCVERDQSQWKLGWNNSRLTVPIKYVPNTRF